MDDVIGPHQTVLVSCRGQADIIGKIVEKDNVTVANFHSQVSRDPPLYLIGLHKKRLSVNIIRESETFVVNFIPFSQMEKMLFVDTYNGLQFDKFSRSDMRKEEAKIVDCPRVEDSLGYVECKVKHEMETGDHIVFIGEILHSEHKRDGRRLINAGRFGYIPVELRR